MLRQARGFGLSLILANQSEADLMSKQANRLLDTVRSNTQTKIYLSVTDPNTVKLLEKASGVISYENEGGAIDYRPRLTVNDIIRYSGDPDLAVCWITRDSGFTAYGGNWFGLRTSYHIDEREFKKRNSAEWPAPTEATIVALRNPEGSTTFNQGTGEVPEPAFGGDVEEPRTIVIPQDSKWAARLNEIFARRSGSEVLHDA